jgi:lipopolysaccharide export system protein LptA
MRVTIKGLRQWILLLAGLLLAVVAGFFIYGRNRFRHIEKDLPARLGINIQQTANEITFSQASQGHTLFTLKAAKQIQLKSGHALLHDVDITLYGPPGSGRADHIYGSDFDYDQKDGIATSQGEVNIELKGVGSSAPAGAAPVSGDDADSDTIHVRTSGLTFVQKTGQATTAQRVDFQLPRAAGSSLGADYNSKTGVLVLSSQVRITTSSNGKSAVVGAGHATLLRASMQAFLDNATIQYETESGSSDHATVYFRKDGTTQRIDASGNVRMQTDTGAQVNSATAHILMDSKSQPTQADLGGGVTFASARDNDSMHGSAQEGTLLFAAAPGGDQGAQTALRHAQFRRDVAFTEEITGLPRDPRGRTSKQMQGQKLDVDFAPPTAKGQVEARKAVGDGNSVVTMRQMPSKGPQKTTRIAADHLVASLSAGNTLQQLDGTGHTRILDESSDGARDTSQGDVLHTTFIQQPAPVPPQAAATAPSTHSRRKRKSADRGPKMQTTLDTAIQDGNVVLTETPAKKPGAAAQPATLTGWAGHAEYHGGDQVLHLAQNPRITDSQTMQMSASLIDYHRDTQDADAKGNVKATYTQQQNSSAQRSDSPSPAMGGNGPVHIVAERAALHHLSNQTFFYGSQHAPARMWQDADSLLAPIIEVDRNQNTLKAWGENTGTEPVVNANFTTALGPKQQQSLVRVHSQTLVYSDKDRLGDFRGSVIAEDPQGTIHADNAMVYLKPAPSAKTPGSRASAGVAAKPSGAGGQNSQVDHMVATGHVVFTQPGRRGEGDKLLYTAAEGKYVLTGTPEAQPKMWDRNRGTTTGAALIFNSQDDSVEVSGGKSSAVTDTRAPK